MNRRRAAITIRKAMSIGGEEHQTINAGRDFFEASRHKRYKSAWDDAEIRLDVADADVSNPDVQVVFDGRMKIDVSGGNSAHKVITLAERPDLFATLKVLINEDCHACDKGNVRVAAVRTINHFVRLIAWMFSRARYKLQNVEPNLLKELAIELGRGGWWDVLEYDKRLDLLLKRAAGDVKLAKSLEGSGHTDKFTCNMDVLRSELRLPLMGSQLPRQVVRRIAQLAGSSRTVADDNDPPKVTLHSLYLHFKFLNRCALIEGFDSFLHPPFKSPQARARALYTGSHREPRTENLGVEDVVTIFTEALMWVHVRADGIVMLCEAARKELELWDPADLFPEAISDRVTSQVLATHEAIAERFALPDGLRALARDGEHSLRHFILKLQFSCAIAVLFNHGRRREEVIGYRVPYGLYRGCLTPSTDGGGSYLDIYIEKTLQRYASMWANEIVERAVDVLERLGQTFRPLGTDALAPAGELADARKDKLFVWRHFSHAGFESEPNMFNFAAAAKLFFADLDVSVEKVSASHIYRRCFALIYMYRHDHPVLMALSRHLCHLTLETTRVYVTDGKDVEDARSIESLFAAIDADDAGFRDEFEDVRSTYFQDKILQILKGESVSGQFARIVAKIGRKLEANASFREASIDEKARLTREEAEKEGYATEPKANTSCAAGSAEKTKRQANCYNQEEGRISPETASAETCADCIHAITTCNHRSTLEKEIEELTKAANDAKRPMQLRLSAQDAADGLKAIAQKELDTAAEMQAMMGRLVKGWKPIVFREKSHA
ncbi:MULTISPECIES: hypothetical protein [unclassified Caballeronia]|uniref:hypothetical protein n=1 Tax=unclassified Caballeronia TaxID=2646786 RepID=UPI002861295A|nr:MULTISPECIES: hypothetical protein [unclassified Caballeronia]MDR5751366.1 hypothetical protein [Caballeronia sp. LZ024]MDR5844492.1 hypothetical protein [Caballeronia sp. LZ031]